MMEQGKVDPGCHQTPFLCADCGRWHVANRVIVRVDRNNPARRFKGAPDA